MRPNYPPNAPDPNKFTLQQQLEEQIRANKLISEANRILGNEIAYLTMELKVTEDKLLLSFLKDL
jgi:hypothetical protein